MPQGPRHLTQDRASASPAGGGVAKAAQRESGATAAHLRACPPCRVVVHHADHKRQLTGAPSEPSEDCGDAKEHSAGHEVVFRGASILRVSVLPQIDESESQPRSRP
jgi:hypothetical protein